MSKIVTFTISIEVDEEQAPINENIFSEMLSGMEEIVGRSPFSLNDSGFEVIE